MSTIMPTVLVVDDEIDTCRNLADIFGDLGYRVDIAHSGESALQLVRKHRYDIALLDLMMPGMDGAELTGEMKKLRAGTVTVLVTAHPGNPRVEAALSAGARHLISKPIDVRQVIRLIDDAVGQPLVLVVDDDMDLCANLWDLLGNRGYRVCVAHDAATAVERFTDDSYKLILLDMKLPDGDGWQVFQMMRQSCRPPQFIFITGCLHEMEPKVQQLLTEGTSTMLQKPIDVPMLLAIMRKMSCETPDLA